MSNSDLPIDPHREMRRCNECGENWPDQGGDACPFCESDDTYIEDDADEPEEEEEGVSMVGLKEVPDGEFIIYRDSDGELFTFEPMKVVVGRPIMFKRVPYTVEGRQDNTGTRTTLHPGCFRSGNCPTMNPYACSVFGVML